MAIGWTAVGRAFLLLWERSAAAISLDVRNSPEIASLH
jgi:hypothetical protein